MRASGLVEATAADAHHFLFVRHKVERAIGERPSLRKAWILRVRAAAAGRAIAVSRHAPHIGGAIADDMDDFAFLLEPPAHRDHRGGHDLAAIDLEAIGPETKH